MEAEIENMQEMFNKDLEEPKKEEMNYTIIETKNALEDSKTDLRRQKKESANLKIGQLKNN